MKLNIFKYLILVLLLTGCKKDNKTVKNYGYLKTEPYNLNVSLKLSEFNNFGNFVDRIKEIVCNDSIPKIVIQKKRIIKNIYPVENCNPASYHTERKHYITFRNGKPNKFHSNKEIKTDSLDHLLKNELAYYERSNKTNDPNVYYVIIESQRNEGLDGIQEFLMKLTDEFDKLETESNFNILFGNVMPIPPLPQEYSEEETLQ